MYNESTKRQEVIDTDDEMIRTSHYDDKLVDEFDSCVGDGVDLDKDNTNFDSNFASDDPDIMGDKEGEYNPDITGDPEEETTRTDDDDDDDRDENKKTRTRKQKLIRKASVAATGGGMVLLGVAFMVLPGPGVPTIVAGLHVLGTEFESAKKVEDKVIHEGKKLCKKVEDNIDPELINSAKKARKKVINKAKSSGAEFQQKHPNFVKSAKSARSKMIQKVDSAKVGFEKRYSNSNSGSSSSFSSSL